MSLKEVYDIVADTAELKWFFDHVIQKPQINESYTAVLVSRHKKLTKEEQETLAKYSGWDTNMGKSVSGGTVIHYNYTG